MKISTINTIELSSVCDNQCQYCMAPIQDKWRKTGFMSEKVFKQAIKWVRHFCRNGTQLEVNLFGVGEPCLHPKVVEFVTYARKQLPFGQDLHLNTNGNRMTLELAQQLKDAGITQIDITAHHAEAAAKTHRFFNQVGIPHKFSIDFIVMPNNWAGQVDWFAPDYHKLAIRENICPWLSRGQIMVMSDGRLTNCCIDAKAQGVFGTVFDDLTQLEVDEMPLCKKCHHITPMEYSLQREQAGVINNL